MFQSQLDWGLNVTIIIIIIIIIEPTVHEQDRLTYMHTFKTSKNTKQKLLNPDTDIKNKLAPYGLTVDSSELTFLPTSKSRDTKTRPNIKNPAPSKLDILP